MDHPVDSPPIAITPTSFPVTVICLLRLLLLCVDAGRSSTNPERDKASGSDPHRLAS